MFQGVMLCLLASSLFYIWLVYIWPVRLVSSPSVSNPGVVVWQPGCGRLAVLHRKERGFLRRKPIERALDKAMLRLGKSRICSTKKARAPAPQRDVLLKSSSAFNRLGAQKACPQQRSGCALKGTIERRGLTTHAPRSSEESLLVTFLTASFLSRKILSGIRCPGTRWRVPRRKLIAQLGARRRSDGHLNARNPWPRLAQVPSNHKNAILLYFILGKGIENGQNNSNNNWIYRNDLLSYGHWICGVGLYIMFSNVDKVLWFCAQCIRCMSGGFPGRIKRRFVAGLFWWIWWEGVRCVCTLRLWGNTGWHIRGEILREHSGK